MPLGDRGVLAIEQEDEDSRKKNESAPSVWKKYVVLLGCVLVYLPLGTMYSWGNISPYVRAYLNTKGHLGEEEPSKMQMDLVGSATLMAFALSVPWSSNLVNYMGWRLTALSMICIQFCFVFLASFVTSYGWFRIVYGVGLGASAGLAYMAPLNAVGAWWPDRRGLTYGLCMSGFGCGASLYNPLQTFLANPDGFSESPHVLLPSSVGEKVPAMLRLCALAYAAVGILGGSMMLPLTATSPSAVPAAIAAARGVSGISKSPSGKPLPTQRYMLLLEPWFWAFAVAMILDTLFGFVVGLGYKSIGATEFNISDTYLTKVGVVAAIGNGLGRVLWGIIADQFKFTQTMGLLAFSSSLVALLFYPLSKVSNHLFLLVAVITQFNFGGNFAVFPSAVTSIFGRKRGSSYYSTVLMAGFGPGALLAPVLRASLSKALGTRGMCYTLGVLNLCVFPLLLYLGRTFLPGKGSQASSQRKTTGADAASSEDDGSEYVLFEDNEN